LSKRGKVGSAKPARLSVFHDEFREDLRYWVETDRRIALRILDHVEAVMRDRAAAAPYRTHGIP